MSEQQVACPPDQQVLGLVEAILAQAGAPCGGNSIYQLWTRLSVIQGTAERLLALLERRDEEREGLVAALGSAQVTLQNKDKARGTPDEQAVWDALAEAALVDIRKAIAAARGGAA
jgi:hypothetical protein